MAAVSKTATASCGKFALINHRLFCQRYEFLVCSDSSRLQSRAYQLLARQTSWGLICGLLNLRNTLICDEAIVGARATLPPLGDGRCIPTRVPLEVYATAGDFVSLSGD